MKAADYFEKYSPLLKDATKEEQSDVLFSMWKEFSEEVPALFQSRRGSTQEAVYSILKEQNEKWNALARIWEEKKPDCELRLAKDGFKKAWISRLPEYAGKI